MNNPLKLYKKFNFSGLSKAKNNIDKIAAYVLWGYLRNNWSYEKEFRIVLKSDSKLVTNDCIPLGSKLLKTVIYGIKFENTELQEKLKSQFPNIEEYMVEKNDDEFMY